MILLAILIAIALIFDFMNGRNDAANSIATIVSTRVLSPRYAVAWAAFFNFVAFLVFGLHVATTIGTGIIAAPSITDAVIAGALLGAICWQVITGYFGIPSSSSHALIGGLVGAVGWGMFGPAIVRWLSRLWQQRAAGKRAIGALVGYTVGYAIYQIQPMDIIYQANEQKKALADAH